MKLVNKVSLFTFLSSLVVLLFGGGLIFMVFDKIIKDDAFRELNYNITNTITQLEDGVAITVLEKNKNLSITSLAYSVPHYSYSRFEKKAVDNTLFTPPPHRDKEFFFHHGPQGELYENVRITRDVLIKNNWYRISYSKEKIAPSLLFFTAFKSVFILLIVLLIITILGNRLLFNTLFKPFYATLNQLQYFTVAQNKPFQFSSSNVDEFLFLNEKISFFAKKSQEDYAQLKDFSENASHELQTPLAIIRSKLDLLQQSENLQEKDLIRIEEIQETLQKVNYLNRALLLLSKIGNQEFVENKEINIKTELETNLKYFSEMLSLKQINLTTDLIAFTIKSNPYLVDVLLRNLIQNAIKHNFIGGSITIQCTPSKMIIINDGDVLEFAAENYFERFKKGNQKLQSTGLGLAVVKQITEVERFKISYTNIGTTHKIEIVF